MVRFKEGEKEIDGKRKKKKIGQNKYS